MSSDKVVGYFYDEELPNFNYGGGNPMRPHRVRLTHSLIKGFNLFPKMLVHRPVARSFDQITEFHADDYVDFLRSVTPDNQDEYMTQLRRFNMGLPGEADCPVFDGLFNYCSMYSGGSVGGAALLAQGSADVCLNWSGGMHHAKKAEASGFCYINDIVLAILELLKVYARVLYVDIDIHHGDGVEEAFYLTDRVMTVSFHKYGDFFPGTGALRDIGYGPGKGYALNVPLREGMDDESYRSIFEPVMEKVMERYDPGAIVVCGGADSLSGDRLGCFNLSLEGHSNCVEFLTRWNKPILVLGGGGYTMRNVARCWCYESGRLMGIDLPDMLPTSALSEFQYYADTCRLRIAVSNMKNANPKEELERIKTECLQNLSELPAVPSVQMAYRPGLVKDEEGVEEDPDVRGGGQYYEDKRQVKEGDESDEEDDDRGPRRDISCRDVKMEDGPSTHRSTPIPEDRATNSGMDMDEKLPAETPHFVMMRASQPPLGIPPAASKAAASVGEARTSPPPGAGAPAAATGGRAAGERESGGEQGKGGLVWREPPVSLSMPKADVMDWSSTPATTNGSAGGDSRGPSLSGGPANPTPAHSCDGPQSCGITLEGREAHSAPAFTPSPPKATGALLPRERSSQSVTLTPLPKGGSTATQGSSPLPPRATESLRRGDNNNNHPRASPPPPAVSRSESILPPPASASLSGGAGSRGADAGADRDNRHSHPAGDASLASKVGNTKLGNARRHWEDEDEPGEWQHPGSGAAPYNGNA